MKETKHQQELLKNLELFIACLLWQIIQLKKLQNISNGPKLFQLYVHKDQSITDDLIDRCKASGFDGMCLTVDTLVAGNRERDHRTGFTTPPKLTLQSLMSFAMILNGYLIILLIKNLNYQMLKTKQIKEQILQNQLLNILMNNMIQL